VPQSEHLRSLLSDSPLLRLRQAEGTYWQFDISNPRNGGFPSPSAIRKSVSSVQKVQGGKWVFLHMFVSPEGALKLFGHDFKELLAVQLDICPLIDGIDGRSLELATSKSLQGILPFEIKSGRLFKLYMYGRRHCPNKTKHSLTRRSTAQREKSWQTRTISLTSSAPSIGEWRRW